MMSATAAWVDVRVAGGVVRRTIDGGGTPLVLVPGCGRDHSAFDPLLVALRGRDVIVPALPGRAGVDGPVPASAAQAAVYVTALLDALGVSRAVVGGHSYGGGVALELAFHDVTERVVGLALLCTGARLRVSPGIFDSMAAAGDFVALADWRACDGFDRLGALGGLRGPAVVVAGADDALIPPRYGRYLFEHIARATLHVVDGAGHEAPTTHTGVVAKALEPLLDGARA
jgi:pimeloyl-ACP methyl ester carboxylesterase